ncbi:MAG: ABC transporter transmembrane domain-containing protein [Acidimicrobiia bacterium]
MAIVIEVREPSRPSRKVAVDSPSTVGRGESCEVVLADAAASRRHAVIRPAGGGLAHPTVEDAGSANGTFVNGVRIGGAVRLKRGDLVRIGDTDIAIIEDGMAERHEAAATTGREPTSRETVVSAALRPQFTSIGNQAIEVTYRVDAPSAALAKPLLNAATKARRQLAGLGDEATRGRIAMKLIDPYFDSDANTAVTGGAIIDASQATIWFVVSDENPPEEPHRPLASLFAEALPCADDVALLVEGWALHLSGAPDGDAALRTTDLPPIAQAAGEMRTAMALSFVRFLLKREGDAALRSLFAAPAGQFDATARRLYGKSIQALEDLWSDSLDNDDQAVEPRQFLKLALGHLKPYRTRQAEVFVYMLLSLAFTAVFPFVSRRLLDEAIPSGKMSDVLSLLIALGIAFAVSLLAGLRQAYQSAWISGAIVRDLRRAMFDRLQQLPTRWYSGRTQGDVLSRMFNDVSRVEAGLSQAINTGLYQTVSLVVCTVIMMRLDWRLGLMVLVVAPLVALVYRLMSSGARTRSLSVQEEQSGMVTISAENHQAQQVVKAFGLRTRELDRFTLNADRHFRAARRMTLYGGLFGLIVNSLVTLLRLAVLGVGAWLIFDDKLTIGGLVAFLSIMGEVISPITSLVGLGQQLQTATGALMRVNDVLHAETETQGDDDRIALAPIADSITFDGVSHSYGGKKLALQDVSFTIEAGTRVAFVGPSGSGKSTILRLLMGLDRPDDGTVSIDGQDLHSRSLNAWRDQLGVVFQEPFLFDVSIGENIALGLGREDAPADRIVAAARAAEIHDFVQGLPRGYATPTGERGGALSGGQRQRISIARALIRDPRVLVLDEATSALDPGTERQINDTLRRLSGGRTVVAVTHRLPSVADFDRINVVDNGRIVEHGTHDELLAMGGVYARLWQEQTGAVVVPSAFDGSAALASIAALSELDSETLSRLAMRLEPMVLSAGTRLADTADRLVVLAAGRAEVTVPRVDGRRVTIARLGVGDAFGIGALAGAASSHELVATDDVIVMALDVVTLRSFGLGLPGPIEHGARGRYLPRTTSTNAVVGSVVPLVRSTEKAPVDDLATAARRTGMLRQIIA